MKLYVYEGTIESMMQRSREAASRVSLSYNIANCPYSWYSLRLKTYSDECDFLVNKEIRLTTEERLAFGFVNIDATKTVFANVAEMKDHERYCGAFVINREEGNNNCYILVDKKYRGIGVAEYLIFTGLERAVNDYKKLKMTDKCRWVCSEWNSNSKRLAVRLGMTLVDQIDK